MTIQGLSGVINGSFIRRFQGVAQGASGTSSLANALMGASTSATVQDGLRSGAQTFATSMSALNQVGQFINLSQATLKTLGEITDKLIGIAEEATRSDISKQTRNHLAQDFDKLANDFQKMVAHATISEREYLTIDGLEELFTVIGLDPKASQSVAAFFAEIVKGTDNQLASETVKGGRPVAIPPSAFQLGGRRAYSSSQVSSNDPGLPSQTSGVDGYVAADGVSVYASENAATGEDVLTITDGTTTNTLSTSVDFTLQTVDSVSGYSVISSKQEFPAGTTGANTQLFLVNQFGDVVHQFTNFASDVTFTGASFSGAQNTIVYSYDSGGTSTIVQTTATLGFSGNSETTLASSATSSYSNPKFSSDEAWVAVQDSANGFMLRDVGGGSWDAFISSDDTVLDYGFAQSSTLAVTRDTDSDGVADTISTYTPGSGEFTDLLTGLAIDKFATHEQGYFAFSSLADADYQSVYVKTATGNPVTSYAASGSDAPTRLSLAASSTGLAELGVYGPMPSVSSDSNDQFYRFTPASHGVRTGSGANSEPTTIFDGTYDITKRPDAYRMLTDLKALQKQISTNMKVLDDGLDLLQANLDLVRSTGLAMLELADQLTGTEQADEVAEKLRRMILSNPAAALSQVENLNPLAASALLMDSD